MTIFVNSSSQRQARFNRVQERFRPGNQQCNLRLLQDVKTRWDSTCHMLIRARILRSTIDEYTQKEAPQFKLSFSEWKQVEYLIDLTRPFSYYTTTIGQTKDVTICHVFAIYDALFSSLHEALELIQSKIYPWTPNIVEGVQAALDKLDKYYSKTHNELGSLYGLAAILNPGSKLESFDKRYFWGHESKDWMSIFKKQFKDHFLRNYSELSVSQPVSYGGRKHGLAFIVSQSRKKARPSINIPSTDEDMTEVDIYLSERKLY